MSDNLIYLDTYVLQQDMRVRMPKSILTNLHAEKGRTRFDVYFDKTANSIVMKIAADSKESNNESES